MTKHYNLGSLARRVDQLATRYYLFRLMVRAEVDSAYALEECLATQDEKARPRWYEQRSRRFNKNLKGTVLKDRRVINRAESLFPGSENDLKEVLWDVLKNSEATKEELDRLFFRLPPQLVSRYTSIDPATGQFVRRSIRQSIQITRLEYQGTLAALACLLIFSRELELDGKPMLHLDAQWAANSLAIRLCSFDPLPKIFRELYDLLFETYLGIEHRVVTRIFPTAVPPRDNRFAMPMLDLNRSIIRAARTTGMVDDNPNSHIRFLFWVDQGPKARVHHALIRLAERPLENKADWPGILLRLEKVMARGFRDNDCRWDYAEY